MPAATQTVSESDMTYKGKLNFKIVSQILRYSVEAAGALDWEWLALQQGHCACSSISSMLAVQYADG